MRTKLIGGSNDGGWFDSSKTEDPKRIRLPAKMEKADPYPLVGAEAPMFIQMPPPDVYELVEWRFQFSEEPACVYVSVDLHLDEKDLFERLVEGYAGVKE